MKKYVSIIAILMTVILACTAMTSCSLFEAKEKTFSKAGISITLTDAFTEKEMASQTAYYESLQSIVTVLKEEFSLFESQGYSINDFSLKDYAELVISNNSISSTVEEKEGLICFKYDKTVSGKNFSYFATVFKGEDAFWLIQFACEVKNYDSSLEQFITWAKSVIYAPFTSRVPIASKEKTFSKSGMTITLTEDFSEKELISQTAYYESQKSIVMILKEDFSLFEAELKKESLTIEDVTLADYAGLVMSNNAISATVEEIDGLICFGYDSEVSGKDFSYFATVFKGEDAFWLVQFSCESKDFDASLEQFVAWAKSFKV